MSNFNFKLSNIFKRFNAQPDFNSETFNRTLDILKDKFPEIQGDTINKIIRSFFDNYFDAGKQVNEDDIDFKQQKSICNFIANVLEKNLGFNNEQSYAIACELIITDNSFKSILNINKIKISPFDLKKATDNILGIEVIYKKTLSSHDWERITNIFMKSTDNTNEYSHTIRLTWDLLPFDVKDAFLELNQNEQRFILYPLNNNKEI
ncbi:MAG: hypothetical protein JXA91_04520 [Candidatus Thermoplasmatota archaeon]|nr:hypothetical protein [Candidatus Thermoplasmatota archaeon]